MLTAFGKLSLGAVQCNQFEIVLYARVWEVTSYYVQDDLAIHPVHDYEMLKPDGIAYREGVLYVSGDREEWNTSSRLAVYSWNGEDLTYDGYLQMPSTPDDWWGPDGLTFNTSGDGMSYGSGANDLVSVEADAPAQIGIINISTAAVSNKMSISPVQDITYIASTGQFATIVNGTEYSTVTIYDSQMTAVQGNFPVIGSAYGLSSVSVGFGQWLSRRDAAAAGFLITASNEPSNTLAMYDLAGNQIGPAQQLPITPKARIPFGDGLYMIEPAFGGIEAIAVDEQDNMIFIGDHGNAMIHVLRPVRLAGDANQNGSVELLDIAVLAEHWLLTGCEDPLWCDGADTEHSGQVDIMDFAVIADQFGEGL
jgi:hypothetical protein